ncbi:MAG: MFS transporter [Chloroflexia bacterium]|nr:MFS transporter [Chloroflexia bacterium]
MRSRQLVLIGLMFVGFISLGLPDGLLGVAWPSIAATQEVGLGALGYLLAAASVGFLTVSMLSGRILARLGVGVLLAVSCLVTALSLLGLALAPAFWMLLPMAMLLGAGGGAIDAGLNTYAAAATSPRVLAWLHACYGLGAAAGPFLMTGLLVRNQPWQIGYLLVGGGQLVLALAFFLSRQRWVADGSATHEHAVRSPVALRTTARLPTVWLSILVFALYTGLEVSVGQWSYTLFSVGRGFDPVSSGQWVGFYWAGLTLGRVVAGIVAGRFSQTTLLWAGSLGAMVGAGLIGLLAVPWAGLTGMLLMGFALAPIFPALIATTAQRVGSMHSANTIGFQIAGANLGAALLPWGIGVLAGNYGVGLIGPLLVGLALIYLVVFGVVMRSGSGERRVETSAG